MNPLVLVRIPRTVTLLTSEMPFHNHSFAATSDAGASQAVQ